jgi:hypothetical protein
LWFGLVRLSAFLSLGNYKSVSGYLACGVAALILSASWLASRRARTEGAHYMVCDQCHVLDTADDHLSCSCGGRYHYLPKMEWINTPASEFNSMQSNSDIRLSRADALSGRGCGVPNL